MASLTMALITLVSLCGGTLLGSLMRGRLPEQHLKDDSRDVIKSASGMIATLVALVIGLLVSSSKSTFDQASANVTQIGAKVIVLNRTLERYGAETRPIRDAIRRGIEASIDQLWPADGGNPNLTALEHVTGIDDIHDLIMELQPGDEKHRVLRSYALSTWEELVQARWLTIEQSQNRLPIPFLAILIFWQTVLFASLGLLTPRNLTAWCWLAVCAASMAGAIFLIMEMNRPLEGAVQISPAPLRKAISLIDRG